MILSVNIIKQDGMNAEAPARKSELISGCLHNLLVVLHEMTQE